MGDQAERRAELAAFHAEAQRRRSDQESARAQQLVDRFVEQARQARLPPERLRARPWSGRGSYRTGVTGWYLRRDRSVGIGEDGGFYVLVVPPVRFGRWRTVAVHPSPPPLVVGRGAGDGDVSDLDALLRQRLPGPGPGSA